ncbi:MAG: T9SS type A sorting domain-containing protein [Bacteroidales bacterium]|nr:T9SS type A sorting domain-containing protein [Bacteroidales bacterium]
MLYNRPFIRGILLLLTLILSMSGASAQGVFKACGQFPDDPTKRTGDIVNIRGENYILVVISQEPDTVPLHLYRPSRYSDDTLWGCPRDGITFGTSPFQQYYSRATSDDMDIYQKVGQRNQETDLPSGGTMQCPIDTIVFFHTMFFNAPILFDTIDTCLANPSYSFTWRGRNCGTTMLIGGDSIYKDTVAVGRRITCSTDVKLRLARGNWEYDTAIVDACDEYLWTQNNQSYVYSGVSSFRQIYDYDTVANGSAPVTGYRNTFRCNKVYELDLNIYNTHSRDTSVTACDSFRWDRTGMLYNSSNLARQNDRRFEYDSVRTAFRDLSRAGSLTCHDTIWLKLTNDTTTHAIDSVAACWNNGSTFRWINGVNYPNDVTDGSVVDTLVGGNYKGCDSVVSLYLRVFHNDTLYDTLQACGHYQWRDGQQYTTDQMPFQPEYRSQGRTRNTGIYAIRSYEDSYHTAHGGDYRDGVFRCDSLFYLTLTIDHTYSLSDRIDICDSFSVMAFREGFVPPTNRQYEQNLAADTFRYQFFFNDYQGAPTHHYFDTLLHLPTVRLGCDSAVTYNIHLYHSPDTTWQSDITMCALDEWAVNGTIRQQVMDSGVNAYTFVTPYGCDSVVAVHINFRPSWNDTVVYGPVCRNEGYPYLSDLGMIYQHDTMVLHARRPVVDDPSMCDSMWWRMFTFSPVTDSVVTVSACDTFYWYNASFTAMDSAYTTTPATPPSKTFAGADRYGCDSTLSLNLTIKYSFLRMLPIDTACTPFKWARTGAIEYTRTPFDTARFAFVGAASNGCDSVVAQPMRLYPSYDVRDTIDACDKYEEMVRGSYVRTIYRNASSDWALKTAAPVRNGVNIPDGCDSLVHARIIIHHSDTNQVDEAHTCDRYTWFDSTFTSDTVISRRHTLYGSNDSLRTIHGCDSARSLRLTVHHRGIDTAIVNACDYYDWNRQSQGMRHYELAAGQTDTNIMDSVTTVALTRYGCDSVSLLRLHLRANSYKHIDTAACGMLSYNGFTYHISDSIPVRHAGQAANGCDSVDLVKITVHNVPVVDTVRNMIDCDTLVWNGHTLTRDTIVSDTLYADNGCDSIVNLTLRLRHRAYTYVDLQSCDSMLWHGRQFYHSTYNFTEEHLRTSSSYVVGVAANGCDSIELLRLQVFPSHVSEDAGRDTVIACDSYTWTLNGSTYTTSNTDAMESRSAVTQTVHGCDSLVFLYLTVNRSHPDTTNLAPASGCGSYTWYDTTVVQDNTGNPVVANLYHALHNVVGCDSVLHITVTVNPAPVIVDVRGRHLQADSVSYSPSVCDSILWRGRYFTQTGVYSDTVHLATGCDSVITLDLVVSAPSDSVHYQHICNGTYTWHNNTYSHSTNTATFNAGPNAQGCDSTIRLNLIINDEQLYVDTITSCVNYTWNGVLYTRSVSLADNVTHHDVSTHSCDSVTHLFLTINYNDTITDTVTACDSYFWSGNNNTYTTSTDVHTLWGGRNAYGCDSVRHLMLTVNYSSSYDDVVRACEEYTWNGRTSRQNRNGHNEYDWRYHVQGGNAVGCDTTAFLILTIDTNSRGVDHREFCNSMTWHGYTVSTNILPIFPESPQGIYDTIHGVAVNGCDSIYALEAVSRGSFVRIDTVQACDRYMWPRNNVTYFESNHHATDTVRGADAVTGCDSIYGLYLNLSHSTHNVIMSNVCDSLIWHGSTYHMDGRYTYAYIDSNGCASVDTLVFTPRHSTVLPVVNMGDRCNFIRWQDTTITSSGTYYRVLQNAVGCDSVVSMSIVINYSDFYDTLTFVGCDSARYYNRYYFRDTNIFIDRGHSNPQHCPDYDVHRIIVNRSYHVLLDTTVCDSYTWQNGVTYTESVASVVDAHAAQGGCDSILTLRLGVNYGVFDTLAPVTACDTFRWQGTLYANTTMAQSVYGTTVDGCDSTHVLPVNIVHRTVVETLDTACSRYTWHGRSYTRSTVDSLNLGTNAYGCDSVAHLNVTILPLASGSVTRIVCDSLRWYDSLYTSSNTYRYTFAGGAANGCDSVVTITLTVNQSPTTTYNVRECDSYLWPINGETYRSSSRVVVHSNPDANGCDSIHLLNLSIRTSPVANIYQHGCDSVLLNGTMYRTSNTYTNVIARSYTDGCDSTTNIRLEIGTTTYNRVNINACMSYTWYDTLFTVSGNHRHVLSTPNVTGCDSVALLSLVISQNDTLVHDTVACDSMMWHGTVYQWSQRGIVHTSVHPVTGCTHFDILNLRMGYRTTRDVPAVTACETYTWHGRTYTASAYATFDTLTTLGCDSIIRMNLTIHRPYNVDYNAGEYCGSYRWHDSTYTRSTDNAFYRSGSRGPNGCDSIVTLHVTIHPQGPFYDTVVGCNSYTYDGHVVTRDSIVTTSASSIHGCDSTVHRLFLIAHSYSKSLDTSVCDGYMWEGNNYTSTGVYTVRRPTFLTGCDTVLRLSLAVRGNTVNTPITIGECPGYVWHGIPLVYTLDTSIMVGTTRMGCDSIETIHFTPSDTPRVSDTSILACDNYTYQGNYRRYYVVRDSIIRESIPVSSSGCDSVSVVRVFIYPTVSANDNVTACDSYTWRDGITYTASNNTATYTDSSANLLCPSIYRLNLLLNYSHSYSMRAVAQDYYQWGDTVIGVSGIYTRRYPSVRGCDSVVTLDLTITDQPLPRIVCYDGRTLMVNHYPYGQNYERVEYYAYRWYRNGVLIAGANRDNYNEYNHSPLNGCYTVEVAIDESLNTWLPSEPYCLGTYGIDDVEVEAIDFKVMPNPVSEGNSITISTSLTEQQLSQGVVFDLYDMQGRKVYSTRMQSAVERMALHLPAGIYTARLTVDATRVMTKKLIVR